MIRPSAGAETGPVSATESPSGSTPPVGTVTVTVCPATTRNCTGCGSGRRSGSAAEGGGFTVTVRWPTAWLPEGFCATYSTVTVSGVRTALAGGATYTTESPLTYASPMFPVL